MKLIKILIIDSSPENGLLIEDFLINSGLFEICDFCHAANISEATEFILTQRFQSVIIDLGFSKDFGLPLIKTIKDYSPSTKIITICLYLTDPCTPNCGQRCLSLGADYNLDKVKHFHLLPATVKKCLSSDLGGSGNYITAAPKKTLSSILRGTYCVNGPLKTPSFLRAKGRKVS